MIHNLICHALIVKVWWHLPLLWQLYPQNGQNLQLFYGQAFSYNLCAHASNHSKFNLLSTHSKGLVVSALGVAILSKGKEKLFLLLPFFHHFVIFFR